MQHSLLDTLCSLETSDVNGHYHVVNSRMDYGEWTPNSRGGYNKWDAISRSTTQVKNHLTIMCQSHTTLVKTNAFMVILMHNSVLFFFVPFSKFQINNRCSPEGGLRFWCRSTTWASGIYVPRSWIIGTLGKRFM